MLNTLKKTLPLFATVAAVTSSAFATGGIVSQTSIPGSTFTVPHLSPATYLFDYRGMEVVVHHCDGTVESAVMMPMNIPNYPTGSAGTFSVSAGVVGSTFAAFAYPSASTGNIGLDMRGIGDANICAIEFFAPTANLVFDRTNPHPGSAGSTAGRDASLDYKFGNSSYRISYVDQIEVAGSPPAGDTYARLIVEFVGSPLDIDDIVSIDVDTDFIGSEPNRDVPDEPVDGALPADFNGDGLVNGLDLTRLLGAWGTDDSEIDLDGDLIIGGADLAKLLGSWTG